MHSNENIVSALLPNGGRGASEATPYSFSTHDDPRVRLNLRGASKVYSWIDPPSEMEKERLKSADRVERNVMKLVGRGVMNTVPPKDPGAYNKALQRAIQEARDNHLRGHEPDVASRAAVERFFRDPASGTRQYEIGGRTTHTIPIDLAQRNTAL